MAATNQTETTSHPRSDDLIVERARVDGERQLAGFPAPAKDAHWTACAVPANTLVVTAEGACRGCEAAAGPTVALAKLAATWTHAALAELRSALAAGHLPRASCRTCVRWLEADLWTQSPMLRLHDPEAPPIDSGAPTHLVVQVPDGDAPLPPAVAAMLPAALPRLRRLTLAARTADGGALASVLALLRAASARPQLALRIERLGAGDDVHTAFAGLGLATVELAATTADAPFAAVAAFAKACGAAARATFVLTPATWFDVEDAARAAALAGVPLALRTIDANGEVPLDALSLEGLQVVKGFVIAAWQRLGGEARPSSLAHDAHMQLAEELRGLLAQRAERAIRSGQPARETATALGLPPADHPWLTDPERRPWYLPLLFGQAHLPPVIAWLAAVARAPTAVDRVRTEPWLRILLHSAAANRSHDDWLQPLRAVYRDAKTRAELFAADAAFARELPLEPYGGPWAERLGLVPKKPRKRPFAIGKAVPAPADATPDVTVLIPSFRHGDFVAEAIRSVLAQKYASFRVLVVDDRSSDNTVARARAIDDPRITVRENERNVGLGNSVLDALATIDTPFVALLNSDDLFHPERLGVCRDVLVRDPGINLVTTGLVLVDADGGEITTANASLVLDGRQICDWVRWYSNALPAADLPNDQLFTALLERNFLATSSNMVARTDWLRAQADSLKSLKYCLDWQLFLEAAATGSLHHVHQPLAAYRLHANNTVWFREGRRWSYYLEVNRVAAAAVRRFAAREGARSEDEVARLLDALAAHLAFNRETDGFALFLNSALDALRLDQLAASSPRVQQLVQQLNAAAEQIRAARDQAVRAQAGPGATLAPRLLLGDIAREQAAVERDTRRWLRGYCLTLEAQLRDVWAGRTTLETEKSALLQRQGELDQAVQRLQEAERRLQDELQQLAGRLDVERSRAAAYDTRVDLLQRDLDGTRADLASLREELATVRSERESVRGALAAAADLRTRLEGELATTRNERDAVRSERDVLRGERDGLGADLARARAATASASGERDAAQKRAHELDGALAQRTAEAQALERAKGDAEQSRDDLVVELARARESMQKLAQSREYRWGNFLWNKMPLAYLSRRGKKWYRRLVDAKNRATMVFRRRRRAQGVAVVAACWHWPIYSHTFVYQEMLGLTHMGLDVQMFHWDIGDTTHLHKAFGYLADHRTQLQPVWENHLRDMEHFEKTKPGRLRAFVELVAQRTGRSVADLEREPLIVQGCTFARMAELAGAKYLHSYFFYDQSFMVMQAAWLLGIPRGVSCYADHMLDDYPYKLVDLHVELADVIVATSARIKRELSAKSGGRFDDKILVKPNGVDGARFPATVRLEHEAGEPFEVVSISRIEPKKGLIHLVEAVADLAQRGVHVVVHVIGSKDEHSKGSLEYAAAFERRIADLGVASRIVLHGMMKQEDLAPILKKSRAFVAPYVEVASGDKDGIPTAMLEALASALPVVTTDAGSILEVVDDGVEGIVVKQGDSRAFADALARIAGDPALERRMAKAARARFDREFDIRVTEKRLHERVASLIAANQRAR